MADIDALHRFFTDYGGALAGGDLERVADCYAYPSYVMGEEESLVVPDRDAVIGAFRGGAEQYRAQGLVGAVPAITGAETLSAALTSVDVRWSYTDSERTERASENYRYIVRAGGEHLAICVVISRP